MSESQSYTFLSAITSLTIGEVKPLFDYLRWDEDERALFLGMRPQSPYAEKYLANDEQVLNHLQVYAVRSLDQLVTRGIAKYSRDGFLEWLETSKSTGGELTPGEHLHDLNAYALLVQDMNA